MRALLLIVLVAALAWSGYWVIGSRMAESALEEWFAERRAEGWMAETAEIDVVGFPNRFDATLSQVALADPETGLAWEAPFFQLLALSYRPHEVIAVWPETQTLASPYQRVEVTSERMRASVALAPGDDLALERSTLVAEGLALDSNAGWDAELETGRLAARRLDRGEATYRLGLEAQRLRPDPALAQALDPSGRLPEVIERMRLDMTVAFDAPWDRAALEAARPQPRRIEIDDLGARWGELELRVAGALDVGPEGLPDGRLTVKASNWREILGLAVEAGLVPGGLEGTLERVLEGLAGLSGAPETLDVPLSFEDGRVSFGPIPVGRVPPLRLR